jgi:hypothetical protein
MKLILCALVVPALYGCAGVDFESLGHDRARDEQARGFRYWQPAPFLFVRSDGQGGMSAEVKWLPDTTQKMSARPHTFFASNQTKLEFADGVMTSSATTVDETAVVNASLAALGKVLVASAGGAKDAAGGPPDRIPVPIIYKIVIDGDRLELHGGPALGMDGRPAVIRTTLGQ